MNAAEPALRAGDTWIAVSAKGKGQPVKLRRLSENHVYFRAFGRGADDSQTFKLPIEAFRVRYAPLSLADDRQRQYIREERDVHTRQRIEGEPVAAAVLNAAIDAVQEEAAPMPAATALPVVPFRKLTAAQAREVLLLVRDGVGYEEAGALYGVSRQNVYDVVRGKSHRAAVADLLATSSTPASEQRDVAREEEQQPVETKTTYQTPAAIRTDEDGTLLVQMADALEFLLDFAGRPLPKYLLLDMPGLTRLVQQAREKQAAR